MELLSTISNEIIRSKSLVSCEKFVGAFNVYSTIVKSHSIKDIINSQSFKYVYAFACSSGVYTSLLIGS